MLRTLICCLLSVLAIMIGGCGTGRVADVPATTMAESISPLAVSLLPTPTPAAQQPLSPLATAPHLASYIGPNAYRQSYPDFIVYYDPALWTFVRNPDGSDPILESAQVLSCTVQLSMGPIETANVRYQQAGPYQWQISDTIDPRSFLYSTQASDKLYLFFGLRVPDVEDSVRNHKCTQLAENVMGTAAFVSASASTPQLTVQALSKYYPPASDIPGATPVLLTPEPYVYVPPTPYPEAATFRDPSGILTITVPKGWYATGPGGVTILGAQVAIANYDVNISGRPDNGIYVSIGIGEMDAGQTFEQWVSTRIQCELSPGHGGPPAELISEPKPMELAGRSGVSLMLRVVDEMIEGSDVVNSIYVPINERWVMGLSVRPATSPDYAAALAMLETLHIADIQ